MITIDFDFHQQSAQDLQHLNNLLFFLDLDDMELEVSSDYLAVTTDGNGKLLGYRYGLRKGRILCTETPEGSGKQYSISTSVADSAIPSEEYISTWQQEHPDEIICCYEVRGFTGNEEVVTYTIIHHQKEIPELSW